MKLPKMSETSSENLAFRHQPTARSTSSDRSGARAVVGLGVLPAVFILNLLNSVPVERLTKDCQPGLAIDRATSIRAHRQHHV